LNIPLKSKDDVKENNQEEEEEEEEEKEASNSRVPVTIFFKRISFK